MRVAKSFAIRANPVPAVGESLRIIKGIAFFSCAMGRIVVQERVMRQGKTHKQTISDRNAIDVIHINVPAEMGDRLRGMAKEERRSVRNTVLVLIEEALATRDAMALEQRKVMIAEIRNG